MSKQSNAKISRQLVVYPLIATMLLSQGSLAVGLADMFKKKVEISAAHPCVVQLNLEVSQIAIMEKTADIINGDEGLRTAAGTYVAASSGRDALDSLVKGDSVGAIINGLSALVVGAQTVKAGSEAIKKGFTLQGMIEERKTLVNHLLANPNLCSAEVQKSYMKLYIVETQDRNKNFIKILDTAVKKAEGNVHVQADLIALSAGTVAALAAWHFASKNSAEARLFTLVLGAAGILGIGGGLVGGFLDLTHNIPTRNNLKAQMEAIQNINSKLGAELVKLN